jgi:hypothetical protein
MYLVKFDDVPEMLSRAVSDYGLGERGSIPD